MYTFHVAVLTNAFSKMLAIMIFRRAQGLVGITTKSRAP